LKEGESTIFFLLLCSDQLTK